MPKSLKTRFLGPGCLGSLLLVGCFGSEPDDSPYTLPRGEFFHSIQLEIEPDGTPLILSQVGMLMAHNDPDPEIPHDFQVSAQNFRSIIHRRSTGGWSATAFKNLQEYPNAFPTLIPDAEGGFQAFLSDGGEIKRYVFGNGGWNRAPGTEWPMYIDYWGRQSSGTNWNRHPRIAVAGADLLLTLHTDWGNGSFWVMEGKNRRVELTDSSNLDPLAFHVGDGFRSLAAIGHVRQSGNSRDGFTYTSEIQYYRWAAGATKAERQSLGGLESMSEAFFSRYRGGTALFVPNRTTVAIYPLDDSGRLTGRESVPLPEAVQSYFPIFAADTAGCLHGLNALPNIGEGSLRYLHLNSCGEAADTLSLPKPDAGKSYTSGQINLRMAPDGTPVAALLVRQMQPFDSTSIFQNWSDPTFLYLAEFRAGGWIVEKVDERRPGVPAGSSGAPGGSP